MREQNAPKSRIKTTHTHCNLINTHTHTPPHATPPQAYPYRLQQTTIFNNVKRLRLWQHQLTAEDVNLLSRSFPFITEEVTSKLMAEKDEYHIVAASSVDVGYDLWEFWRDNRMRIPHWYSVAKDMALMQPPSAFMERVFSILRACMDERQEPSYSDRIAASAPQVQQRARETVVRHAGDTVSPSVPTVT